jgi:tRNA nucleotidyltransferase (CCA-adding enzyme)
VLAACGALAVLAPQLDAALRASPAALAALQRSSAAGLAPAQRWAALLAGLDEAGAEALSRRLHAPNEFRELAQLAARVRVALAAAPAGLAPEAALALIERSDALRRPERFAAALRAVSEALSAGVDAGGHATGALRGLEAALARVATVQLPAGEMAALPGPQIAARLRALRLAAVAAGRPG